MEIPAQDKTKPRTFITVPPQLKAFNLIEAFKAQLLRLMLLTHTLQAFPLDRKVLKVRKAYREVQESQG